MLSWDFILLYNCDLIKHWLEHRSRTWLVYKQISACKHKSKSCIQTQQSLLSITWAVLDQPSMQPWELGTQLNTPGCIHPWCPSHSSLLPKSSNGSRRKMPVLLLACKYVDWSCPADRESFYTQCWQAAIHTQIQLTHSLSSPRRENVFVLDPIKSLLLFIL